MQSVPVRACIPAATAASFEPPDKRDFLGCGLVDANNDLRMFTHVDLDLGRARLFRRTNCAGDVCLSDVGGAGMGAIKKSYYRDAGGVASELANALASALRAASSRAAIEPLSSSRQNGISSGSNLITCSGNAVGACSGNAARCDRSQLRAARSISFGTRALQFPRNWPIRARSPERINCSVATRSPAFRME